MLRQKRSRQLAGFSAKLLADHGKIEAAPILLRYALSQDKDTDQGSMEQCVKALETMRIREVGLAIVQRDMMFKVLGNDRGAWQIPLVLRERLTGLLGRDAGPTYQSWIDALLDTSDQASSRLPEAIQDELDREVACYWKYTIASNQRIMAQRAMPQIQAYMPKKPDYDAPTIELFEQQVDAYAAAVDKVIREQAPQPAP
jgi:hypothetical protein